MSHSRETPGTCSGIGPVVTGSGVLKSSDVIRKHSGPDTHRRSNGLTQHSPACLRDVPAWACPRLFCSWFRTSLRRFPGGRLSVLLVALVLTPSSSWAGQRVVAWGDIAYDLPADSSMSQISSGFYHSLALTGDGAVLSWGDNRFNQTNIPEILKGKLVAAVAAGNVHNLALLPDGQVTAWGPAPGQMGDYGQAEVPASLGIVTSIAAGAVHNLALRPDGTVVAWGANLNGQCDVPAGLNSVSAIAGGMYHSLALRTDGTVVAWGDNAHGQTAVPPGLNRVVAIAAGGYHNLVLTADGSVVSWGAYGLAQCDVPAGLSNVVAIATGDLHSLALKRDGSLVVWGFNTAGQCSVPQGLTNVAAIAARGKHSVVLVNAASENGGDLKIEAASGTVTLSWPVSPTSAILEQNPTLDPAKWTAVTSSSKVIGTRNTVVLPASGNMFFRLVRP